MGRTRDDSSATRSLFCPGMARRTRETRSVRCDTLATDGTRELFEPCSWSPATAFECRGLNADGVRGDPSHIWHGSPTELYTTLPSVHSTVCASVKRPHRIGAAKPTRLVSAPRCPRIRFRGRVTVDRPGAQATRSRRRGERRADLLHRKSGRLHLISNRPHARRHTCSTASASCGSEAWSRAHTFWRRHSRGSSKVSLALFNDGGRHRPDRSRWQSWCGGDQQAKRLG